MGQENRMMFVGSVEEAKRENPPGSPEQTAKPQPSKISEDMMKPKAKRYPCYTRDMIEIPANSSVFVPVTTHGSLPMREVWSEFDD